METLSVENGGVQTPEEMKIEEINNDVDYGQSMLKNSGRGQQAKSQLLARNRGYGNNRTQKTTQRRGYTSQSINNFNKNR